MRGSKKSGRSDLTLLLALLDDAFERKTWHGPNLRGSLRGVTAREAAWRPAPGRHNIWELAVHAAYWKYAVRRMLTGEKRGSFPEKGSNWFRRPGRPTDAAWRADQRLLVGEHRKLREAAASVPAAALARRPAGSKFRTASLISGAANHDLYHAGQIQLLKALLRKRHGS